MLATSQDLWYLETQRHTSHPLCLFLLANMPLSITGTGCWGMWILRGPRAHGEACQEELIKLFPGPLWLRVRMGR